MVQEWVPSGNFGKISFIAHSLGGLIVRAALPHLENFKHRFDFYISLSAPHLGYTSRKANLIDFGIWFLKKWSKSKCLA